MMANDVVTWTVLFMSCLTSFGLAMFLSFPVTFFGYSTGKYTVTAASKFNHPLTSITSMLQLGLLGALRIRSSHKCPHLTYVLCPVHPSNALCVL